MITTPDRTEMTAIKPHANALPRAQRPGQLRVRLFGSTLTTVDLDVHGSTITFGRSRSAGMTLDHASVSKFHFTLRVLDGAIELADLGSTNGTWFMGRQVRRITLLPGDRFLAGQYEVELVDVAPVEVEVATQDECGLLSGGKSLVMRELFARLLKLAPHPLDLLIEGETGTGKELTARTIHELSPRKHQPFVILDCSNLATSLADATMFGFRRGAFPGADDDQAGVFERAHGGTLFIDEIGELAPALQMKFLRALDCRQVARIGEPNLRDVDVRVIAASNRDLVAAVDVGQFRQDLLHRIAHARVRLPTLRERGLDVIALAEGFLRELLKDCGDLKLGEDAKMGLITHDWPGNIRELKNTIRRAAWVCTGGIVRLDNLDLSGPQGWESRLARALDDPDKSRNYEQIHELVDRLLLPAVREQSMTLASAARTLGISRQRLRERLKSLGLYDSADR